MYIYTVGQREEGSRDSKGWSRAGKKGTLAYNPLCTVQITKSTLCSLSLTLNREGSREDRFRSKEVYTRETKTDVRKYTQEHREVNKRLGHAALTLICTMLQQEHHSSHALNMVGVFSHDEPQVCVRVGMKVR